MKTHSLFVYWIICLTKDTSDIFIIFTPKNKYSSSSLSFHSDDFHFIIYEFMCGFTVNISWMTKLWLTVWAYADWRGMIFEDPWSITLYEIPFARLPICIEILTTSPTYNLPWVSSWHLCKYFNPNKLTLWMSGILWYKIGLNRSPLLLMHQITQLIN